MEQGIKFVITGDTAGLDAASKKAESALGALNRKIAQLQKEIGDNIQISQGYEKAIADLSNELKKGTISQNQYAKSLSRLQRDEKETTVETNNLRKQLSQLQRDQKSLASSTGGAVKGFNNMNKSATNVVPVMTSFSQVVQDAPYGIRGVANNIQQLTAQFGYLQKSSGGTKGAFKALVGSLTGPAGILLAVSAVTSLLVTYGDKLKFASDKTSELSKASKDYVGDALAEKEALESLLAIARDETATKVQRKAAIDEINKNYSKYLGFLDEDSVKTDKVSTSVKNLTFALIQKAKIEGLSSVISEKTKDVADDLVSLDLKRQNALASLRGELVRLNRENAFFNKVIDETDLSTIKGLNRQLQNVQKASKGASSSTLSFLSRSVTEYKNLGNQIKDVNSDLDDTLSPLLRLQENLKKQVFEIDAKINIDDGAVIIKGTKKVKNDTKPVVLPKIEKKQIIRVTEDAQNQLNSIGQGTITLPPITLPDLSDSPTFDQLDAFREKMVNAQITADIFSSAVSSSFSALASEISASVQTGSAVVDAFVGSIINSLASLLSQMIAQSITQAIVGNALASASGIAAQAQGVQIATQAAAAFGPLGFALLPGLLAATATQITTALALAKVPKFAQGGIVGGGSFTGDNIPILVNSGERILTVQDQSFLSNILRGNTAGTTNNGKQDPLVGQVILRGSDLYVALKREEKRR